MIRRASYIQRLLELKDQNLIKVVTGVRRSGKSTIMEAFKNELIESGVALQNITCVFK
jgi:predicted AAA+ superfamily ATPase